MRPPVLRLHTDELIVDNFAGGGGASVGIEWALGRSPDIAINHDPQAVAMHQANHPDTKHYVEDVWKVDPVKACGGRPVGLAWFSPDCKHFSKAKGGKPVSKNIRGLAWIVVQLDLPLATVQAEGNHHAAASAFMVAYYGNEKDGAPADEPMRTVTARDRLGLVMVEGAPHQIVDIGMRMLVPPELYLAQGFPRTYKINIVYKGKPLPKDAQVRMCGNSVSPYPCAELVRANFLGVEEAVAA